MTSTVLNGHDIQVLVVAAVGIAIIVALIVWLKLHAFLALTVGALFVGVGSGIPLGKVTASYENGVGGVLGYVGVLIALGAMVGKLLADSGGADKVDCWIWVMVVSIVLVCLLRFFRQCPYGKNRPAVGRWQITPIACHNAAFRCAPRSSCSLRQSRSP